MASACQLCGSVGGRFSKGTMASACLDARHFNFSQFAIGTFQDATPVLKLRGSELVGESVCGFFKRNCLTFRSFFR